ncbi:MAG: MIP family channel protein [Bacteroidetes bacterium]|nr:MIP family channel protein [Bacteroidota bacterium]
MKKHLAEFLGTFGLVFAGTGAIVIDQQTHGGVTHAGVAITFGLIVMSMIYTFGEISGAHLNPAVSIAFAIGRKFPFRQVPLYIVSQVAGAIAASATLRLLFPANDLLGATLPAGSAVQSFILEFILTFFLMLVIFNVAHGSKEQGMFAGLAIGAVVGLEAMFAGPICGASMNPARSLAPAVVSGHLASLWIYLVAPVIGAATAVPVWRCLRVTA